MKSRLQLRFLEIADLFTYHDFGDDVVLDVLWHGDLVELRREEGRFVGGILEQSKRL